MDPRNKNGIKQLISRNTGKVIFPKRAPTRPIMTVTLTAIVLKTVNNMQYTNFDCMCSSSATLCIKIPEWKSPVGRHRCRWNDLRMDLIEIGTEDMDCIHLTHYTAGATTWVL